jgi:ankyrin repeat protein
MKLIVGVASGVFLVAAAVGAQRPTSTPPDPMYSAIRSGDTSAVTIVLQGGGDVNAKERRGGATPLMNAAAFGSVETIRLLIEKGADVNARSAGNATALMWAANDPEKVKLLVEKGADVNAVSELGHTPLMLAAMSARSSDSVRLLLARGADPKRVAMADKTTALIAATRGNDIGSIRQLVEAGGDVDAADVTGATPLMYAASHGNLPAVQLLLAKGAHVNVASASPDVVPSARVKNGIIQIGQLTPLLVAIANYAPKAVIDTLIAAGADVNANDVRHLSVLMTAVATDHGDPAVVRALIARGADVNVKDLNGETALDWAMKAGSTQEVAMLKRAGAHAGTPAAAVIVPPAAPVAAADAVQRAIAVLERTSGTFFERGACGACHAQNIADIALTSARRRLPSIPNTGAMQRAGGAAAQFASLATQLLERMDGPVVDIAEYTLAQLRAAGWPADRATDALVFNIAAQQLEDGSWRSLAGPTRPPIEDGNFTRTALGLGAFAAYPIPARQAEMKERIARAANWLRTAKAVSNEDRAFRLLGLAWSGMDGKSLQPFAKDILAAQRPDGGWSQRQEMTSDAYATGLSMFALRESGAVPATDPGIQRGATFLLSMQRADGTWYVRSRSPKFQPYFESGFPYGHDQWISSMATGWATAALAATLPEPSSRAASR